MITFKEYLIEKPLTPMQRIQRAKTMKRLAPKLAMKRKMAAKKKASPEKIKSRAQKQARDIIRDKLTGGKNYHAMSYSQKVAVDQKLQAKAAVVKKLSKKLIPQVKKAEAERLKKLKDEQN